MGNFNNCESKTQQNILSYKSPQSVTNNNRIIISRIEESSRNNRIQSPQPSPNTSIIDQSKKLPGFSFKYNVTCDFINDTACCICFYDYHPEMIMQMLPCNHIIHKKCLQDWYNKSQTCPICRSPNN